MLLVNGVDYSEREWPRLVSWLCEARDDIQLQHVISEDAAGWERNKRPGDRLYRGTQFKEAQAWAKRNPTSKQEHAFLQASVAAQIRSLIAVIAVILFVIALSGVAGWFFLNRAHTPDSVTTTDEYAVGSLRWAIGTAHPGDTITFDPALVGQTLVLKNADITIFQQKLIIQNPARGRITIQEIGASLVVDPPAHVTISNVAFQGSNTQNQLSLIENRGELTLNNSTLSGNTATGSNSFGGGISNDINSTLTLNNSTLSGNTAAGGVGGGGGIWNAGTLTLNNSTLSGNTVTGDNGGGIYSSPLFSNSSTLTLANSTISDNKASSSGGGIYIESDVDPNRGVSISQVDLTFCTVYGNTAHSGGDIEIEDIGSDSNGNSKAIKPVSQVKIRNSIVAGAPAHPGPDIVGMLTSYGYNLFQDNSGATFDPATRTQHGTDKTLSVNDLPKLFADPVRLQDNSGPTRTYALAPGSPALDVIPLDACLIDGKPSTDQRGVKRPKGSKCDIGAYEYP